MLAGKETQNVVVNVALRHVVLVTETVAQRQTRADLPRILRIAAERSGPNAVHRIRELEVVVPESADKVREFVACEITEREIKTAVVEEIEIVILPDRA